MVPTTSRSESDIDYATQIKPILAEKCYSCHGTLLQESDLRVETRSLLIEGGSEGAAIVPGDPDASPLWLRIRATVDQRMPPPDEGAPLRPEQIELLRRWILQGAPAPEEPVPPSPREHWAFQTIRRPTVPDSPHQNPIDAFLHAKRDQHSLRVQPPAERAIAIRRLYLDLIGLPPTVEQMNDPRPWEEIATELLTSPHHGERWGRHWMDIWRYSDWYGLGAQLRYSQKHMWHWRDWIVQSLNDDKGYDRMVSEMLAGDEIAPEDPEVVAATGYLARNYYLFNRTTWLDSTIEHSGKAFLGLTLNCAKCHDHKYDPISQLDYYRFRALFEPHQVRLDPVPGVTDLSKDGLPRVFDDQPDAVTYLHRRGNPADVDEQTKIRAGVPRFLSAFASEIRPIALPATAYAPGTRADVQNDHLRRASEAVDLAKAALEQATLDAAKDEVGGEKVASAARVDENALHWVENFERANPERWTLIGDGWRYSDGRLEQTRPTRQPDMAKLRTPLPADFDLTCRYTTTGGTTYKSVTFRFDQSEDARYGNFVYTSAHAPSPKVQVAYTRDGNHLYPPQGRVTRPIKIGTEYRLRVAVRDTLVNVWLDDQFQVAYRLPDRKPQGFFSLSAFDATASFDSLEIRSLPVDAELQEPSSGSASESVDPATRVAHCRADLEVAQSEHQTLQAVIAADRTRYTQEASESDWHPLARRAKRLQLETECKRAERDLQRETDAKKIVAIEKRLQQHRERLATAEKEQAIDYASLRVSQKALETPAHKEPDYPAVYASHSTGRRSALARWITDARNPLTARVAVNQIWMRHFGRPLVESVFDFGLRSPRPLHAELLDLLAYDFIQSGWSMRALHRRIVTSDAYRLSSSTLDADPAALAADPDNRFYWRMPARRMESQIVRDSMLALAGELDRSLGGPSLPPDAGGNRRSLYFTHSRDAQDKFLSMFDDADLLQCYRRSESVVPQQALALSNSNLAITLSEKIASRLTASLDDQSISRFIDATFRSLLARAPSQEEGEACESFCASLRSLYDRQPVDSPDQRVRARLVQTILNHNDFISIR